jgi:hypothetical protein
MLEGEARLAYHVLELDENGRHEEPWLMPVALASTVAATLASDFASGDTLDGSTLASGDRILIKDQADPAENGVYIVTTTAPRRADDALDGYDLAGRMVLVETGTANEGTVWRVEGSGAHPAGTDLTFVALTTGSTGGSSRSFAFFMGG